MLLDKGADVKAEGSSPCLLLDFSILQADVGVYSPRQVQRVSKWIGRKQLFAEVELGL